MYDPIVSSAISALVQFFLTSAGEASKKIGEETGAQIYEFLRKKFKKNSFEAQALERLKEKPSLSTRQNSFKMILLERVQDDPEIRHSLYTILKIKDRSRDISQFITQKASNVQGNVFQVAGNLHVGDSKQE